LRGDEAYKRLAESPILCINASDDRAKALQSESVRALNRPERAAIFLEAERQPHRLATGLVDRKSGASSTDLHLHHCRLPVAFGGVLHERVPLFCAEHAGTTTTAPARDGLCGTLSSGIWCAPSAPVRSTGRWRSRKSRTRSAYVERPGRPAKRPSLYRPEAGGNSQNNIKTTV
jgi:hypothetical protein